MPFTQWSSFFYVIMISLAYFAAVSPVFAFILDCILRPIELIKKVEEARASLARAYAEGNGNQHCQERSSKKSSTTPSSPRNLKQPCLYHDPKDKRHILIIFIICVIYSLPQIQFSYFLVISCFQLLKSLYGRNTFLISFVDEVVIYSVLLIFFIDKIDKINTDN